MTALARRGRLRPAGHALGRLARRAQDEARVAIAALQADPTQPADVKVAWSERWLDE